jgi:hypothetical protein
LFTFVYLVRCSLPAWSSTLSLWFESFCLRRQTQRRHQCPPLTLGVTSRFALRGLASHFTKALLQNLRHTVKHNTVDKLKQILTGFNEECSTVFHKSGRKQDLIERIVQQLENWRQANNIDKWTKAKAILYQVRSTGM